MGRSMRVSTRRLAAEVVPAEQIGERGSEQQDDQPARRGGRQGEGERLAQGGGGALRDAVEALDGAPEKPDAAEG